MKIVLCNPKVNLKYSHSRKGMYLPLGLLSLATYLEINYVAEIHVQILDGDIKTIFPESLVGADLVGFYANSFNYGNCMKLAKKAKESGATIILGGPHATVLWKNIMKNRIYVDYIILNEGEIPLSLLVGKILGKNKLQFDDIPNLVYRVNRDKNTFKTSPKTYKNSAKDMIIPSRKYINIEKYIQNYKNTYSESPIPFQRPSSIYSSKGCIWRDKTGGCVFCARLEKGVVFRDINELWRETSELKNLYNIDSIWDISDDNLNDPAWFKDYVDKRPQVLSDIGFFIYTRVNRITDDIIPYFRKLNVFEVYLGFESGDQDILKKMVKGISTDMAIQAARRLKDAGIYYFPSFVIGLPGESINSLENTLSFAKRLADIGSVYRMSATILWPAPGSPAFNLLLNDSKHGEWLSAQDDISIRDLEKIWISRHTQIDYETAEKYQSLISNVLLKSTGAKTFGGRIS